MYESKTTLHSGDCNCVECERKWQEMDKKINKIKSTEKKALKETDELLKMDKRQDKKMDKLEKMKKKGKC